MRRREFITLLSGSAVWWLLAPPVPQAQQVGKVYRIGYLSNSSSTANPHLFEAFRQGLRELGWVEGQNISIDPRFAEGRSDRLADLAAELVRLKVDIIITTSTPATLAAKNATGTTPIVAANFGDPVGLGLIESLARPNGNITGLSFSVGVETFGKELELLKEIAPEFRRVAVLSNPTNPYHAPAISNVKVAAQALKVELQLLETRGSNEFDGAFAAMSKERAGALLVVTDPIFVLHRARLADLASKNRLPSMYGMGEYVKAGGLIPYGPNLSDRFRHAATFVDKILKGAKPADLPVQQPTKFELTINLRTAKTLGLTVPPSLLARADEVIE
jgi:putative ABC transport system substrate-binding protein